MMNNLFTPFSAILFSAILLPFASAYTFTPQAAAADSVRLVQNEGLSHDDILAIDVQATQVPVVYSAAFDITFDSSVLLWEGSDTDDPDGFLEGPFFGSSAWANIGPEKTLAPGGSLAVNPERLVAGVVGGSPVSGSGTIMTIFFRVVGTGTSQISFSNSALLRQDNSQTSTSFLGASLSSDAVPSASAASDDPPTVSLISPDTGATQSSSRATLTCQASDDVLIEEITLFTDSGGPWGPRAVASPSRATATVGFDAAGLTSGTFRWNCRARDSSGQMSFAGQNRTLTVSLPADTTPPVRSGGSPSGSLGSTSVTISVTTNEDATCRYSLMADASFSGYPRMNSTDQRTHTASLSLSDNQAYTYYIKCRDVPGNENPDDYPISFSIGSPPEDNEPPAIIYSSPAGSFPSGTEVAMISVATAEPAQCRYSLQSGSAFSSMQLFTSTGLYNHTVTVSTLSDGASYTYYIKCRDSRGNINVNDFAISFSVGSGDATAPTVTPGSPGANLSWNTPDIVVSVTTSEPSQCRYSLTAGTPYSSMSSFSSTGGTSHSTSVTVSSDGRAYNIVVMCRDPGGNTSPGVTISFFVCYEVDSDCSRDVSMGELLGFMSRWHILSSDVTMAELIESLALWKSGSA